MKSLKTICAAVLILAISGTAQAVLTTVTYIDTPVKDVLLVPPVVHELGNQPPFPTNEWITSSSVPTLYVPSPIYYAGGLNVEVTITNKTGSAWKDLWYVSDYLAALTNDDGFINNGLAFKIDTFGMNIPLVYEDNPNGIFEVGETWKFVIQDYANVLGLPASAFGSIGVGFPDSFLDQVSPGSIIAVPAPGAILLGSLGAGLVGWIRRRRTL